MAPSWPAPENSSRAASVHVSPVWGKDAEGTCLLSPSHSTLWVWVLLVMSGPISPCPQGWEVPARMRNCSLPPLLPPLVSCAPYLVPCPVPAPVWGSRTSLCAAHLQAPGTHWALPSFSSYGHLQPFLGAGPACDPQCHPCVPSLTKQTLNCSVLQRGQASTRGPILLAQEAAPSPGEMSGKLL